MKTLTKAQMTEQLMQRFGWTKQEARAFVEAFFESIVHYLSEGKTVKLSGFGNFELKNKAMRPARNPRTGEEVMISARRVVTFRAGQKCRGRILT